MTVNEALLLVLLFVGSLVFGSLTARTLSDLFPRVLGAANRHYDRDRDVRQAEVAFLRAGIETIRDEAWEAWVEQDWQRLDTIHDTCNALLKGTRDE